MRGRLAYGSKEIEKTRTPTQTDEPIATVGRRAEHRISMAKFAKGAGDIAGSNVRNITADDHHGSRRQLSGNGGHAAAQIAPSLWQQSKPRWPRP